VNVKTRPAELALMLTLDPVEASIWHPEDLRSILRDQLAQPIAIDLSLFNPQVAEVFASNDSPPIETFDDLLHHPSPPLELLRQTRKFAKLHSSHPASNLPRDVATVLYFACIVAARRTQGDIITGLDDYSIIRGLRWVLEQHWLDDRTRSLFKDSEKLFVT